MKMRPPLFRRERPPDLVALQLALAAAPGTMPMHEALGFMTALITMPTMLRPKTWIEAILGKAQLESATHAQNLVNLLMLAYNDIATKLQKGGRVGPSRTPTTSSRPGVAATSTLPRSTTRG